MRKTRKLRELKIEHMILGEEVENLEGCLALKDGLCSELVERKTDSLKELLVLRKKIEDKIYQLM